MTPARRVHELDALADRNVRRIVQSGKAIGADELVFLHHAVDLAGDEPAGLVLAISFVRCRDDGEALVLDLSGRCRLRILRRRSAAEKTFQERHGLLLGQFQQTPRCEWLPQWRERRNIVPQTRIRQPHV
jgi:hypothetical protein